MFSKATLLATVSLALSLGVDASPIVAQHEVGIPLTKRAGLTTSNGVFDSARAKGSVARTQAKYRQNLINLQKNKGSLPAGARIMDLNSTQVQRRDGEPLTDESEELWAGDITIGGQKFLIDFDTGSADLWIPSTKCTSSQCSKKDKFDASKSKTAKKQSGTFSIQYGDGSTVSGPVYTDSVTVAGVAVTGQYFSPVETLSASFADSPEDGILGLAYPAISNLNHDPFFNTAKDEGKVDTNAFGFKLASSGSELFLGGTNSKLYTGDIEYHNLANSDGFWQIGGASISLNGAKATSGFSTIIDSGTTIMYGPPSTVKTFYGKIKGSKVYDQNSGLYSFPCSSVPKVSFNWGGKDWAISADNFNLGQTEEGSSDCVGALAGQDLGLGNSVWLLGDSLMKNVYTAFDFDKNAVGFATLA